MIGLAGGEGPPRRRGKSPTLSHPAGAKSAQIFGDHRRSGRDHSLVPLMTLDRVIVALVMFHPH